jgi:glyoxylase-like metal-dependent hydrolase (beta-lactamase superfamily II)
MIVRNLIIATMALLGTTSFATQKPWKADKTGITVIPGAFEPGRQPDGNTVVFDAPEGLVVLDTGRHPEHTQKILDFAKSLDRPIVAVINSHWHLDHVSGNPRLRAAHPGLKVYATNAIDGAMHDFFPKSKEQAATYLAQADVPEAAKAEIRADIASIDSGKALYPDVVVTRSEDRKFGGRPLHLGLEKGTTRGDLWVYDAAHHYLAAGDLVTLPVPFLDTACAPKWSLALSHLDALDFTTLVPGHGPTLDHAQFKLYRSAFDKFRLCAASTADKKSCAAGWVRDAGALMAEPDRSAVGGMLEYYVDVLRDPTKINC